MLATLQRSYPFKAINEIGVDCFTHKETTKLIEPPKKKNIKLERQFFLPPFSFCNFFSFSVSFRFPPFLIERIKVSQ